MNGTVSFSSHWLYMEQNETAELSSDHRMNQQETRTGIKVGPQKGWFLLVLDKGRESVKNVFGKDLTCMGKR
jgi:hypothetical protein